VAHYVHHKTKDLMQEPIVCDSIWTNGREHSLWIVLLGKRKGLDWNIRPLRNIGKTQTSGLPEPTERFLRVLNHFNIQETFAPRVNTFSKEVALADSSWKPIFLNDSSCVFHGGILADAVMFTPIGHRQAFWVSSADCPTLVVSNRNGLWASAHCGRDSVIDPESGKSVVYNLVKAFEDRGSGPASLSAWIVLGIQSNFFHPTDHKVYGNKNREMLLYLNETLGEGCVSGEPQMGNINLKEVIRKQLLKCGLFRSNIHGDNHDTFIDRDEKSGNHKWWSARRAQETDEVDGRNGVLVFPFNTTGS